MCPLPQLLILLQLAAFAHSHGFLSTPRSRNLVAHEDRVYYPVTPTDPFPEDCPHCLNRGGTLARCGKIEQRNYDFPKNALGDTMPSNPQETYVEGQIIDVEVQLTAHHKGHFVFSACPISNTTTSPTQECFDANRLTFVSDELYGAPVDINHPERAYVAPQTIANKVYSEKVGFEDAMVFRYKLKLPENVVGELVLIQWYYVASNTGCVHEGYDTYDWPQGWSKGDNATIDEWEDMNVAAGIKPPCSEVLPEDGNGK